MSDQLQFHCNSSALKLGVRVSSEFEKLQQELQHWYKAAEGEL